MLDVEKELKKARFLIEKVAGLESFELEEFLGKGAFGGVFKAKLKNSPVSNLYYAIKVIKLEQEKASLVAERKFIENVYGKLKTCCPSCVVTLYPEYIREGICQPPRIYDTGLDFR